MVSTTLVRTKPALAHLADSTTTLRDRALNVLRTERFIIRGRYALGAHRKARTFQDLANRLGVSKERVRQLEQRAVAKLRNMAAEFEMEELFNAAMV